MKRNVIRLSLMAIGVVGAQAALASGYHFGTQSAAGQGVANANSAEAADASTIFHNPAGLTKLEGTQVSGVLNIVDPKVAFHDQGSTISSPDLAAAVPSVFGAPRSTGTNEGGKFADRTAVPHFYFSHKINDQMSFGVGAFVPFGSKTTYDAGWVGRYNVVETEVKTFAINPSFAYRINPMISVGGGVTMQYAKGKLGRKVNYGGMIAGALAKSVPGAAQSAASAAGQRVLAAGGTPAQAAQAGRAAAAAVQSDMLAKASAAFGNPDYDGYISVEGDDWGYGYNFGVMFEFDPNTRLGLSYRSKVSHKLKGNGDWSTPDSVRNYTYTFGGVTSQVGAAVAQAIEAPFNPATGTLGHADSGANVAVDTPESLSIGFFKQINDTWAVMADYTRSRHSRFKELRIDFDSTTPDSITPENWKDTNKFALGTNVRLNESWMLRFGWQLDRSPVTDANRTPSIPDGNRTWYSMGANYRFNKNTSIDLAYSLVKVDVGSINATDNNDGKWPADRNCNCSNATVRGNFDVKANIVGLQVNHVF
ncbi:long-chain fatty acid transport protein [Chitinivorax tropicus]|uniref:Long-chain fatty acid transport protein n=1 Tax=Chitinivorax tropicus TaxID=714531 RepID=A0A840MJT0_9PROT|nr:OmpP1/FadL family transporter [Chitinivorax tropicus]MBB5018660.1 long-chain fatty acid transport protein [Chitinivorax tropicus]